MPRNMQMRQIRSNDDTWTQEGNIVRQTNPGGSVWLLGSVDARKRNQATLIGIRVTKFGEYLAFGFGKDVDNRVIVWSSGVVEKRRNGGSTVLGNLESEIGEGSIVYAQLTHKEKTVTHTEKKGFCFFRKKKTVEEIVNTTEV